MFRRAHYLVLALCLRGIAPDILERLVRFLEQDNPKFNRNRFIEAIS